MRERTAVGVLCRGGAGGAPAPGVKYWVPGVHDAELETLVARRSIHRISPHEPLLSSDVIFCDAASVITLALQTLLHRFR